MKSNSLIMGVVVALIMFYLSAFFINEGERGMVLRFGRVLKDTNNDAKVYQPGLHFKIPMLDTLKIFSSRIQTMDDPATRFVTSEKKDVNIDFYVKWKIEDFNRFYLATSGGRVEIVENLLRRKVLDSLRAQIGSKSIQEIVSEKREEIMVKVLGDTKKSASDLGIMAIDVRMKQINPPETINRAIYARMTAERDRAAKEHRAKGEELALKIRAQADLERATILADADKQARITRGNADANVAKLYAEAYNKDPEFYSFTRSLEAYSKSFNSKNDLMVIDPSSDFFHYMKSSK